MKTTTCPKCLDAEIKVRFTALSINSMHINIMRAFFLIIIPRNPIEKRIAASVRYQSVVTSSITISFLCIIS